MAVEAISWALNEAPVDEPSAAFVLVGLANHCGPDGRAAFPSVATLAHYTRLSERTVRDYLDVLEEAQIITASDPAIVAAYIKRADRRPQSFDVDMTLSRDNPEQLARFHAALAKLQERRAEQRKRSAAKKAANGVQPLPEDERGATVAGNGVQPLQERGATAAPEPSFNRPSEPSSNTPSRSARGGGNAAVAPNRGNSAGDVVDVSQRVGLFEVPEPALKPKRERKVNPDNPFNLAIAFEEALRDVEDFSVRFGAVNHSALAKNFRDWLARGVSADEIRAMITLFASDARHRTKGKTPWVDFLGRRTYLANQVREAAEAHAWNAVGTKEFNEHWNVNPEDLREYSDKRTWGEKKADLLAEDPSLADLPESELIKLWMERMEADRA